MHLRTLALAAALAARAAAITDEQERYNVDPDAPAVYFKSDTTSLVFGLQAVPDTGDVYFHLSAAASDACWIGVAWSDALTDDALALTAYRAASDDADALALRSSSVDGAPLTLSPRRVSSPDREPVHDASVVLDPVSTDAYEPYANTVNADSNNLIIAHAVCRNCTADLASLTASALPMTFLLGPSSCSLASRNLAATLPPHRLRGSFTLDMTQAVADEASAHVPPPNVPDFAFPPSLGAFVSEWSSVEFDLRRPTHVLPPLHATLMCVAFLLVFPAGALSLLLGRKPWLHGVLQTAGLLLVLAAASLAIPMSDYRLSTRTFTTPHQLLGLIIVFGLLGQLALGLLPRCLQRPLPPLPHLLLGPTLLLAGLVNAGLGFSLAARPRLILPYAIVAAVVAVVASALAACLFCLRHRRRYRPDRHSLPSAASSPHLAPPTPYEPPTPYSPTFARPHTASFPFPLSPYPLSPRADEKRGPYA